MQRVATHVWPADADGDVLRGLAKSGFNFDAAHPIDFNIDFNHWPPSSEFVALLKHQYPEVRIYEPEGESRGYILFVVHAKLTYELIMFVQSAITEMAGPFGGVYESWGVLH